MFFVGVGCWLGGGCLLLVSLGWGGGVCGGVCLFWFCSFLFWLVVWLFFVWLVVVVQC